MLILLPPSEGKAAGGDGPPVRLEELFLPGLTPVRERVLNALVKVSGQRSARQVLGLSEGQAEDLARNRELRQAPTLPAASRYTGVLYDKLGLATLDPAARARAAEQIVIFSGLWGVLRIDDPIPAYRLSMAVKLPRLGGLAGVWRPALDRELAAEGLVVDLRSGVYAAAWKRPTVAVRVVRERLVNGTAKRTVVSHMAKATRGEIARALLQHDVRATTKDELIKTLVDLGYLAEPTSTGLDIVVND